MPRPRIFPPITSTKRWRDAIGNNSWTDENTVIFRASAHDQDAADPVTFYYEVITATGTFTSAVTPPAAPCAYNTAYEACNSRIWAISTTTSDLPGDWYSEDWLYRKIITIHAAQVAATESDFAVLATTTDADLAALARSDGYDILFTAADGTTLLDYEREYYDYNHREISRLDQNRRFFHDRYGHLHVLRQHRRHHRPGHDYRRLD